MFLCLVALPTLQSSRRIFGKLIYFKLISTLLIFHRMVLVRFKAV